MHNEDVHAISAGAHSLNHHQLINYRLLNWIHRRMTEIMWRWIIELKGHADEYYIRQVAGMHYTCIGIYKLNFPIYVVACTLSYAWLYIYIQKLCSLLPEYCPSNLSHGHGHLRYLRYNPWFVVWAYHHGVNWQYSLLASHILMRIITCIYITEYFFLKGRYITGYDSNI